MINKKYSYKDLMGKNFSDVDAKDFNNSQIIGSCFYQEGEPDQTIFPKTMEGVVFIKCNLDNVVIPNNNTVEDCSCKRIKFNPDDKEDWIVDEYENLLGHVGKTKAEAEVMK